MNLPDKPYFERLDSFYKDPSHLMYKKMRFVVDYLKRGGGSLIDIGCGTGEYLVQLTDRFKTLVGIDTSAHAIEYAAKRVRERKNIQLKCGELSSFRFPAGHFNVCLCLDVLEHVEHPLVLLGEIHKILRPGAELIVTVPNWYDIIFSGILKKDPLHVTTLTPWTWMSYLRRAGFKVKHCRAVEFPILKSDLLARRFYFLGMCILIIAIRQPGHGQGGPIHVR